LFSFKFRLVEKFKGNCYLEWSFPGPVFPMKTGETFDFKASLEPKAGGSFGPEAWPAKNAPVMAQFKYAKFAASGLGVRSMKVALVDDVKRINYEVKKLVKYETRAGDCRYWLRDFEENAVSTDLPRLPSPASSVTLIDKGKGWLKGEDAKLGPLIVDVVGPDVTMGSLLETWVASAQGAAALRFLENCYSRAGLSFVCAWINFDGDGLNVYDDKKLSALQMVDAMYRELPVEGVQTSVSYSMTIKGLPLAMPLRTLSLLLQEPFPAEAQSDACKRLVEDCRRGVFDAPPSHAPIAPTMRLEVCLSLPLLNEDGWACFGTALVPEIVPLDPARYVYVKLDSGTIFAGGKCVDPQNGDSDLGID
jgi:hypothetical protein